MQHRVLRAFDASFGVGDFGMVDSIGRFEAEQDLRVVHRLFLRMANPGYVLEKSGEYWNRFYDTGRWVVRRREGGVGATGVLRGMEPFDASFGPYVHAYIVRMWELVGAKRLSTRFDVREGPEGPEIFVEGRWQ